MVMTIMGTSIHADAQTFTKSNDIGGQATQRNNLRRVLVVMGEMSPQLSWENARTVRRVLL